MKKLIYIFAISIALILLKANDLCHAQNVGINNNGAAPDPKALLDVNASPDNNKGLLIPRLTTAQQTAIVSPPKGLIIYNTDCNTINYFNGGSWIALGNVGTVNTPGIITQSTATPCQNGTGYTYSIGAVAGATGYNWTVPTGATVASGQGTLSITVSYGTINGSVCVSASNACGSSNVSCRAVTLTSDILSAPTANAATSVTATSFTANWTSSPGATAYFLDVSTVSNFASFVSGFNNLNVNNVTSKSVTGISCNTTYFYRVRANNVCTTSPNSGTTTLTTVATPAAPTANAATVIVGNAFTANWTASPGATTYFLDVSTVSNFASFVSGFNNLNVGNVTSKSVTGLSCGTPYFYRVRANNPCGTSGNSSTINVTTFNTPAAPVAASPIGITQSSFTARWFASPGATTYFLDVSTVSNFASFVPGYSNLNVGNVVVKDVTGLSCITPYFYRVRAGNTCGTSGNSGNTNLTTSVCSSCGSPITDSRDGQTYETLLMPSNSSPYCDGRPEQCWMKQNLNVDIDRECVDGDPGNCDIYGGFYSWQTIMQGSGSVDDNGPGPQGICPDGWHVPTDNEWKCLEMNLDMSQEDADIGEDNQGDFRGNDEGGKLKEEGTDHWDDPNEGATNSTGFSALGTGYTGGQFRYSAHFWTATDHGGDDHAWYRELHTDEPRIFRGHNAMDNGFSVRCVKD